MRTAEFTALRANECGDIGDEAGFRRDLGSARRPPIRIGSACPVLILGIVLALPGLILTVGGIRLIALHGSWYYALAGVGLLISGVLLAMNRSAGAWLFDVVFLGTLLWTLWEVGLDFWGFVPRVALPLVLAILVAPRLPGLKGGPARSVSRGIAATLAFALVLGVIWAFVPHGVYRSGAAIPAAKPAALASAPAGIVQSVDAPAIGDWAAYGHSNAATRYSALRHITRENVHD